MAEYRQIISIIVAMALLLAVMLSVGAGSFESPAQSEKAAETQTPERERFPGQIYNIRSDRKPHRLTSYTMDSYGEYTDKSYTHSKNYRGMKVYNGVDVSAKQNGINWLVLSQNIDFAFIRVGYRGYSEGQLFVDRMFHTNMRCAQKTGVKTGVYIYSQAVNCDEIREEARLVLENIAPYKLDLPVVLDIEYAEVGGGLGGRLHEAGLSEQEITQMCQTFCEVIRLAGYTPMIYANSYMMRNKIDENAVDGLIWIAYPGTQNGYDGRYTCWQYSWAGRISGIKGDVDCDYIYANELSAAAFE